jgi:hypothetical protein
LIVVLKSIRASRFSIPVGRIVPGIGWVFPFNVGVQGVGVENPPIPLNRFKSQFGFSHERHRTAQEKPQIWKSEISDPAVLRLRVLCASVANPSFNETRKTILSAPDDHVSRALAQSA